MKEHHEKNKFWIDDLLAVLERKGPVKQEGKGWRAHCPAPDHPDRHPSFLLYPSGAGRCFTQCARYWSPNELSMLTGVNPPDAVEGLSVEQLAAAKGLPQEFLRSLGISDGFAGSGRGRKCCVDIPYANERGEVVAIHKRLRLDGAPRFIWRRGDHAMLYGLSLLREIRTVGRVILVEGESDAWTLWHNRIPALALPGASTWRPNLASLFNGLTVFAWHEPDGGGDGLVKSVSHDLPGLRVIQPPPGVKDPSELYLQDPEKFKERMEVLTRESRPVAELRTEALSAEARACFEAAKKLLESPDILEELGRALGAAGYAGDPRPALMAYIGIASRLVEEPLNLAFISQSASGKNAAIDAVLPFFPDEAYYLVRASSPRALVYNDQLFTHRTIIMTEADSLPEDGPAASAIRSLMSDREMTYEVVEKDAGGHFKARHIHKPGPTGLITSSIKPLGDQANTRTLTVSISDSADQTRQVLHAQADRANQALGRPDPAPWIALQVWLALDGERRVIIPFAHKLADAVPATAVRMRRDFAQLLTVIKTIAFLRQRQRGRDAEGRILATLDDYAKAQWLLEEVFTTTVNEGVTPTIRNTVEAVAHLGGGSRPVSEQQLVEHLGLAKSSVNYRVHRALRGGWLVNLATQRGVQAQLVLGMPLPDGSPLPEPEALVCADYQENDSNTRTPPQVQRLDQLGVSEVPAVRTPFEPGSKGGSSTGQSHPAEEFEEFESLPEGSTRTKAKTIATGAVQHPKQEGRGAHGGQPWDEFLVEVEGK